MGRTRILWSLSVLALIVLLASCDEVNEITVVSNDENGPPVIVRQGPEFPATTQTAGSESEAPVPWVLVGDPDGLDDISAVLLDIESIRLHSLIVRPDADDGGCANVLYEPNNTIDTSPLFQVPLDLRGVSDAPLGHDEGGIYRIAAFRVPSLEEIPAFEPPSDCATGDPFLDWAALLPPNAPTPTDVFLTRVDVEYIGLSVTVYDKVGARATTTFPDLRIVYTTSIEEIVAP